MLIASRVSRIKASLDPHKDSYFLSFEKKREIVPERSFAKLIVNSYRDAPDSSAF